MSQFDLENCMEDFRVTLERTRMAAKWNEATLNEWREKGRAACGGVLEEATTALEKAEAREAEEVRVQLMETTQDELVILASEVGDRTEDKEQD